MDKLTSNTINYFQSSQSNFWHWADNGSVVELTQKTVCYREDLTFILESLTLPQPVPLGTFILLFCACKDNFETIYPIRVVFHQLFLSIRGEVNDSNNFELLMSDALSFLRIVNALPYKYRMGLKRILLYQAILEGLDAANPSGMATILREFKTGEFDAIVFKDAKKRLSAAGFMADLKPLADALMRFPDKETLELKLRTGLTVIPKAEEVTLAELPEPDDLFAALEADVQTMGISRLARQIVGALSIPMHLSGSSDQSVGGISDISNRGHYDKLLLSELAQDDLLLTARLANNEALFLQREELPVNNSQEWHILLDSTLKMWGIPRVFGLAAGLAFSEGRKSKEPMNAWALGGKKSSFIDLHSKEGIINSLEILDPALNCGRQLVKLLADQKGVKGKYIMITADHYREDVDFLSHFLPIKDQLDYLVVVSRSGHIELFETQGGRHKLLNQATIDLDEALFAKPKLNLKNYTNTGLPAMLQSHDFPLFFPASKIKFDHTNILKTSGDEIILITQDHRVLLWENKLWGAIEIAACIEKGEYHWAFDGKTGISLLVNNRAKKLITIYHFNLSRYVWATVHTEEIKPGNIVKYHLNDYHIKMGDGEIISIDPVTGNKRPFFPPNSPGGGVQGRQMTAEVFNGIKAIPYLSAVSQVKRFVNNGYSVVNSARSIYIHNTGRIMIDHRELCINAKENHIILKEKGLTAIAWLSPVRQEIMDVAHLSNIRFTKFIWANGSEAVLDSRGLLHLKSNDVAIPQVSIILVVEKTTACWSADGMVTGSAYFTGKNPPNGVPVADFYEQYIQSFIKGLK
jgi:hypothetical protein